mmetsp:Transcript_4936/g.13279  ORF Transcript_4936/g.13279 Transcript_4936/m.13279 type:complete len:213 (-) Transcript_4936:114-752(-)
MLFRMSDSCTRTTAKIAAPGSTAYPISTSLLVSVISRGTVCVLTGSSAAGRLSPTYEPAKLSGTETPNHTKISNVSEKIGTALVECKKRSTRLRNRNSVAMIPDKNSADQTESVRRFTPPTELYSLLALSPQTKLDIVQKKRAIDSRLPRLAGDTSPRSANTIVAAATTESCVPEPTKTHKSSNKTGIRNTSPCRSFQPDSTLMSSSSETPL